MENIDSLLQLRQANVIRNNLLSVFRFAVKALIDKACFCSIDDGCEEFINFSAAMEHILQHRLRSSKTWYLGDDRRHFWFYIKAACRRHDLRSCITNIDNIENIRSPVAKGRAFLRCALMEKRLAEYLGEALKQIGVTRQFYLPGAIMLGEEAAELCGILLGLNSIDFGFCVKGENYDTVECPLTISYTPFMKFKQSQESLYSDLEEMRELSCTSSLASEDGGPDTQETPSTDCWLIRYSALHKRYMCILEQKSFLEEVMASQEKALQVAAAAQQEQCLLQQEAAEQKRQYEGVILELQAQVTQMKAVNEALQEQLALARKSHVPLAEMEGKGDNQIEASRFAAAMAYKQDSDRQSLTSSYDRGSIGRAGDTRSLISAVSDFSLEVSVARIGQAERMTARGEDTQSLVPLTGSLADFHLDLEAGTNDPVVLESSSTITNPEQATPVVSVNSEFYTFTLVESSEINGNATDDNVHFRNSAIQEFVTTQHMLGNVHKSEQEQAATQRKPDIRQEPFSVVESVEEETDQLRTEGDGLDRQGTAEAEGEAVIYESNLQGNNAAGAGCQGLLSEDIGQLTDSGGESTSSKISELEELMPDSRTGERGSDTSDRDVSEIEFLSQELTSSKDSAVSSKDKEEESEPEILTQDSDTSKKDYLAAASEKIKEIIIPELFIQNETTDKNLESEIPEQEVVNTDKNRCVNVADDGKVSEQDEHEPSLKREADRLSRKLSTSLEPEGEKETANSSDAGSSDGNKDTWDMLSDANQDSS